MNVIESRINSYEMALIEVAAYLDEDVILAAMRAIRSGITDCIDEQERTIRLQALRLLDLGLERGEIHLARGLRWQEEPESARDALSMLNERLDRPHPPGDD